MRISAGLHRLIFDAGAQPYDLLTRHRVWHEHCRLMLDKVPPARHGASRRILDLGCGPGVSAIEMSRAGVNDRVLGVDVSRSMLKRARRHVDAAGLHDEVPLTHASVFDLPFRTGSVDACTGHSFLYLLPDRARALEEMRRVLRPGGAVVLLEPAAGAALPRLARHLPNPSFALTMSIWMMASRAAGRFTPSQLEVTLARAGFVDIEMESTLEGLGLLVRARRPE